MEETCHLLEPRLQLILGLLAEGGEKRDNISMKRMVEGSLAGGGTMLVEVELDEEEQGGMVPAARGGEMAATATQTLQEALEQVKPGAEAVVTKLREMSTNPDEMEITFGLKLSAEAGAFIASASTEANFSVRLMWNRA